MESSNKFNIVKLCHGLCIKSIMPHPFVPNRQETIPWSLGPNRDVGQYIARKKPSLHLTCSQRTRQQAYLSLVRPHVEYCSPVWNPWTNKDISRIEAIQRRAARFVLQKYHRTDSVTTMLNTLEWQSLEKRRQAASLTLMYKMQNNLIAANSAQYLLPCHTKQHTPISSKEIPTHSCQNSALCQLLHPSYCNMVEHPPWQHLDLPNGWGLQGAVAAVI